MLNVKTPEEAKKIIMESFHGIKTGNESVTILDSLGRTCGECVVSEEYVPGYDRSTVDGYAVRASDTFGSSDSIPAIMSIAGEVTMGSEFERVLFPGECAVMPTGGYLPKGADAVVMLEYTESYGDGTVGITKPAAPGENVIFRGDDLKPGEILLHEGVVIKPHDIGGLAAMGITAVTVRKKPVVGIISTGDELVPVCEKPRPGQIRDVNSSMLCAQVIDAGGKPILYEAVKDEKNALAGVFNRALNECDIVLISGGSSVGMKDATAEIIKERGQLIFHGIAIKPGKPTIFGRAGDKAIFGLPGHPVAAHFITRIFVRPLIKSMMGEKERSVTVRGRLSQAVPSNHGRAECVGVRISETSEGIMAEPIRGKSGLITMLAGSDGYFIIPRDCEGLSRNAEVDIILYR